MTDNEWYRDIRRPSPPSTSPRVDGAPANRAAWSGKAKKKRPVVRITERMQAGTEINRDVEMYHQK